MVMLKKISEQKGSVSALMILIVVTILSMFSAVSFLGLINSDHEHVHSLQDGLQQELLLRSEGDRIRLRMNFSEFLAIPDRTVEILEPMRNTTYTIEITKETDYVEVYLGFPRNQIERVNSHIYARRATRYNTFGDILPEQRQTFRLLGEKSLAEFQYFSDHEESENSEGGMDHVKFWGPDELNGPVYSNDNIYVQNGGGGWPTFHSKVITSKKIYEFMGDSSVGIPIESSNMPVDEIFLDGYQQEVPGYQFSADATRIRQNGIRIGGDNTDIIYMVLDGANAITYEGTIVNENLFQDFEVLSWFPDSPALVEAVIEAGGNWYKDAEVIWTNSIAIPDTIWTVGGSYSLIGSSAFVDCELWIKSSENGLLGNKTVGCSGNAYIIDNIKYENTELGDRPDADNNTNSTDFFGLVSESQMFVKYKHWEPDVIMTANPDESAKKDPNISDGEVWMYGCFVAGGEGNVALYNEMNSHYQGIFTFEYQHLHGATPNYVAPSPFNGEDSTYQWIDFQRMIFPVNPPDLPPALNQFKVYSTPPAPGWPSCGFPAQSPAWSNYVNAYPNADAAVRPPPTDWPWLNPVWPEGQDAMMYEVADAAFERGVLHIYGMIAQRRRGFIHRSGSDPKNHLSNSWDIENFKYGGIHGPSGYDKDYYYDERLLHVQPVDFPTVHSGFGSEEGKQFGQKSWFFSTPPR